MSDEIQVGDYVRTKNGIIRKIIEVLNSLVIVDKPYYEPYCVTEALSKRDITKHSKNIIDLIQKDDFVNGCKVYEVDKRGITVYQKVEHSDTDYNFISVDEIKSIVTSEQFKNIEYIVED